MASSYEETVGQAIRSAKSKLQFAALTAGIIDPDEWIEYIPGSRSNGYPPEVNIQGWRGPRPLDLMPDFTPSTRGREVAIAMETAAATLRKVSKMGALPVRK